MLKLKRQKVIFLAKYLSDYGGMLENMVVCLFKHNERKYLEDLRLGNIYMNNFKYFIDREKKDACKGIGDKYEAGLHMRDL